MTTRKVTKTAKTGRFVNSGSAIRKPKKTAVKNISQARARRIGKSILHDYAGAFRKLEKN